MKRKRYSVEQIVGILKQAEMGTPVADLIRRLAPTEAAYQKVAWLAWDDSCALLSNLRGNVQ